MTGWNAVVFDVDGTLLDTSEGEFSSVRYTIEAQGLAPLSDEELCRFYGSPIQDSVLCYEHTVGCAASPEEPIPYLTGHRG